jgi:hypothetical protein
VSARPCGVIAKDAWSAVQDAHDNIDISIVVEVSERGAAPGKRFRKDLPRT